MHHGAPSKIEPPLATYVAKKTVASLLWQDYGYTALLGGLFFIFSASNHSFSLAFRAQAEAATSTIHRGGNTHSLIKAKIPQIFTRQTRPLLTLTS